MATYTPAALIPITALTATPGTSVLTGAASTTYVFRTFHFETAASKNVTLSLGADAVATRLWDAFVTTAAVPAIFNGWWVQVSTGAAHDVDASINSTTGNVLAGGYTYA